MIEFTNMICDINLLSIYNWRSINHNDIATIGEQWIQCQWFAIWVHSISGRGYHFIFFRFECWESSRNKLYAIYYSAYASDLILFLGGFYIKTLSTKCYSALVLSFIKCTRECGKCLEYWKGIICELKNSIYGMQLKNLILFISLKPLAL